MKTHLVSNYAEDKIFERKIRRQDIPDFKTLLPGIQKVSKKIKNRTLSAFYKVTPETTILMTAYWSQK